VKGNSLKKKKTLSQNKTKKPKIKLSYFRISRTYAEGNKPKWENNFYIASKIMSYFNCLSDANLTSGCPIPRREMASP
jgi:hypothetical protein